MPPFNTTTTFCLSAKRMEDQFKAMLVYLEANQKAFVQL